MIRCEESTSITTTRHPDPHLVAVETDLAARERHGFTRIPGENAKNPCSWGVVVDYYYGISLAWSEKSSTMLDESFGAHIQRMQQISDAIGHAHEIAWRGFDYRYSAFTLQ